MAGGQRPGVGRCPDRDPRSAGCSPDGRERVRLRTVESVDAADSPRAPGSLAWFPRALAGLALLADGRGGLVAVRAGGVAAAIAAGRPSVGIVARRSAARELALARPQLARAEDRARVGARPGLQTVRGHGPRGRRGTGPADPDRLHRCDQFVAIPIPMAADRNRGGRDVRRVVGRGPGHAGLVVDRQATSSSTCA